MKLEHLTTTWLVAILQKNEEDADKQLKKANGHIVRSVLDCYKFLNVFYNDAVEQFEKETRNIDLKEINDGDFYYKYKSLKKDAVSIVRMAKTQERNCVDVIKYDLYEKAYNKYTDLYNLIEDNRHLIVKMKFRKKLWVIGSIIWSGITFIFGCILTNNNLYLVSLFDRILKNFCGT